MEDKKILLISLFVYEKSKKKSGFTAPFPALFLCYKSFTLIIVAIFREFTITLMTRIKRL